MYYVVLMGGKPGRAHAVKLNEDDLKNIYENELENIHQHISQGNPIIIVEKLEELESLGITDVNIVED